jgi:hypothetical protein
MDEMATDERVVRDERDEEPPPREVNRRATRIIASRTSCALYSLRSGMS